LNNESYIVKKMFGPSFESTNNVKIIKKTIGWLKFLLDSLISKSHGREFQSGNPFHIHPINFGTLDWWNWTMHMNLGRYKWTRNTGKSIYTSVGLAMHMHNWVSDTILPILENLWISWRKDKWWCFTFRQG
jgi:hypothetical protein